MVDRLIRLNYNRALKTMGGGNRCNGNGDVIIGGTA